MARRFPARELLRLVGLVYDAATDPSRWIDALAGISDAVNSRSALISITDFSPGAEDFSFLQIHHFDPEFLGKVGHYFPLNPFNAMHLKRARPDTLYVAQHLVPDTRLRRTEYYNDWLKPQEMDHMAGAWLWRNGPVITWLDCQRPDKLGPYSNDEMATLEQLRPHLLRATQITQRLGIVESQCAATFDALERLPHGVVLLNEDTRIVYTNRRAEALLDGRDGLTGVGRRLGASDGRECVQLQRIVADAVETALGRSMAGADVMTLVASTAGRPVHIHVSPINVSRGLVELAPNRVCALAVIAEPDAPAHLDADILRLLYGLTPAEARLAAALADGQDLSEIAESFHIRRHTARTQLKAVMEKTGARRQAELVRLLLRSPGALSEPE